MTKVLPQLVEATAGMRTFAALSPNVRLECGEVLSQPLLSIMGNNV